MRRHAIALTLLPVLACLLASSAHAYVVGISPGPRSVYLRVGDGAFGASDYASGGTPQSGGAVNTVAVTVPAAALMTGADQAMSSTSRLTSDYDGFTFCTAGQTYIGGFFRGGNGAGNATLTATVTAPLSNGADTIPFSQVRWTASGIGDGAAAQPIAANNFGNVTKNIATFPVNSWRESCHSFFYDNDNVVAAGTYVGTITYTLTSP
ncbi:MAG: hypothetical protein ACREPE_04190 [Lysobacter sp.]